MLKRYTYDIGLSPEAFVRIAEIIARKKGISVRRRKRYLFLIRPIYNNIFCTSTMEPGFSCVYYPKGPARVRVRGRLGPPLELYLFFLGYFLLRLAISVYKSFRVSPVDLTPLGSELLFGLLGAVYFVVMFSILGVFFARSSRVVLEVFDAMSETYPVRDPETEAPPSTCSGF